MLYQNLPVPASRGFIPSVALDYLRSIWARKLFKLHEANAHESHQKLTAEYTVCCHPAGVLGFSADGGFWLSHSVPKYPDSPAESHFTGIHVSQTLNGQSFACVSLGPEGIEDLGPVLETANLYIYSPKWLPENLQKQ